MKRRMAAIAVAVMAAASVGVAAPAVAQASITSETSAQASGTFAGTYMTLRECQRVAAYREDFYDGDRDYWCTRTVTDHGVVFQLYYDY